jgi:hypothetical protein
MSIHWLLTVRRPHSHFNLLTPLSPSKTCSTRPIPTSPRSSSSPPTSSTTLRPTATPSRTLSTQRSTSTTGGGSGMYRSKRWNHFVGHDWKGCTVCEICANSFAMVSCTDLVGVNIHMRRLCRRTIISVCSQFSMFQIILWLLSSPWNLLNSFCSAWFQKDKFPGFNTSISQLICSSSVTPRLWKEKESITL